MNEEKELLFARALGSGKILLIGPVSDQGFKIENEYVISKEEREFAECELGDEDIEFFVYRNN